VVLGWSAAGIIQPTLPLLILDRGGDALLIGFVAALFATPTLLLRPFIGRRIDRYGHGAIHQVGVLLGSLAPLGYTLPGLTPVPIARVLQGVGWSMFGTANNVVLAKLAPPSRRGEASGYFNVAYAAGWVIGPPVGLFLYANAGPGAPFVAATGTGLLAVLVVTALRRATEPAGRLVVPPATAPAAAIIAPSPLAQMPAGNPVRRAVGGYLEPTAIPTMLITATFLSSQALFAVFAPVYARAVGAPVEWLAIYFPLYGGLLAVSQLVTGQVSDRLGRRNAVVGGALLGSSGLFITLLPLGFPGFTLGACAFAVGAGIVTPATAAATMDQAPPGRLGASMATFSMAYQLAGGVGGALWGVVIATLGFPYPFLFGAVLALGSIALAVRHLPAGRVAAS
jgi:MFS family permease